MTAPGVALVTGGSRGVGQGIAVGLAEAGWTVHVTGRNAAGLAETVARVEDVGGTAYSWTCEHTDDADVARVVEAAWEAGDRIDVLVNNAWAGPRMNHARPERFWERPLDDWDTLIGVGLRTHWVAAHAIAPRMIDRGSGVVVNVSSVGARAYLHSVLYGISKAGLDKMTHDAALELRAHGVTVLSLWPGLVRTEQLLASGVADIAGVPVSDAETPELQGRVLAALLADPDLHRRTGSALITAELAEEYAVSEPDGGRPVSPRLMFGGGPVFPPLPPG
ncbi:SDR family NAD(P)-dependent oxidoreductase [Nocardioides sp. YIM 152315]|uniref:SDR family NAD(P)-dependent oxidoreductase n=1 Tax=Nocardioides sp. YIM 152315 TaxID=3031760 RepID=UPI0023DB772D|nr:SDR family NAD(P)-dependent oxidoreductase [Nocardioides sp. YIM 152315]MDF1604668.1 SDR family NAD(P)-dependent oxidoreductase [Nocardioides sp. YIM 152315]